MEKFIYWIALFFSTVALGEVPGDHAARMKAGTTLFKETIRPALKDHCVKCHGDEKVRSGLDISSRELLLKGGESGPAIDLKEPKVSFLLSLVRHEEDPTMPPKKPKLSDSLIADMQRWISLGAPYDEPLLQKDANEKKEMQITDSDREFWSFQPLSDPDPPKVTDPSIRSDIDRFIFSKLEANNLSPNTPADKRSLIRRAYLDVIGLPPTLAQLEAALARPFPEVVDELLSSPHYGERWARHWLDAARFAESHGFEQDYDRKYAYHYRDFVIKAFNADMPWNQFIRWQLAGDEIAPDNSLAMMATGFLGAGVFPTQLTEKEFESARYDELDDMAATTGTAMLGLTIGCARCHDHKFDPIPVKDYYRFVSTFTTTIRSEIKLDINTESHKPALEKWQIEHAAVVQKLEDHEKSPPLAGAFEKWLQSDALKEKKAKTWTIVKVSQASSSSKATTLTSQPDGAILATGNAPASETYTVKSTPVDRSVRFLRIEALTHNSMKRKGPGRAGNGNFALSNLQLFAASGDGKKPIKLQSPKATHQQNKTSLSVASAIDGDPRGTGWAVDFGGIGKDHAAVFELAEPIPGKAGTALEVLLTFANNTQHSMGRFRISICSHADPPVTVGDGETESFRAAFDALEKGSLLPEHRKTLFSLFASTDPKWNQLKAAVGASTARMPKPNLDTVQVTSEGFKPTKHHADGRGFPHFYKQTHFLNRGDPNQKIGVAPSGFLQVLMRNGKTSSDWATEPPADWTRTSYRRRNLANWIADSENGAGHLVARVAVNRLWHHHFGRGIVATPNDFGLQGATPSHPGLLDFLARRLIENGWKLKQLHREILLSKTWQQSSAASPGKLAKDPDNSLLWRFTPRRLEAEIVRDSILSAAGQLDPKMFGPGTLNEAHRRRSIYFMMKRSRLIPMMQIFDQPEPLASQGRRPSTTIAPQALLFMNNSMVLQWAAQLASQLPAEDEAAIRELYLRIISRPPTADELQANKEFLAAQIASYPDKNKGRQLALADLCQIIFGLNEFVYYP